MITITNIEPKWAGKFDLTATEAAEGEVKIDGNLIIPKMKYGDFAAVSELETNGERYEELSKLQKLEKKTYNVVYWQIHSVDSEKNEIKLQKIEVTAK